MWQTAFPIEQQMCSNSTKTSRQENYQWLNIFDLLCKSEWMLFLIDLSSAILDTNPNGHYNVIQLTRRLVFHFTKQVAV